MKAKALVRPSILSEEIIPIPLEGSYMEIRIGHRWIRMSWNSMSERIEISSSDVLVVFPRAANVVHVEPKPR